ncbi:MAG TPA: DUF6044 family protein, partial [Ohtaekwangia sp.]|uniref:DUF6044 family protein n=1 Tax=Ohtaekwangia sp. TaxID=2066019 RepID=UPI002F9525F3
MKNKLDVTVIAGIGCILFFHLPFFILGEGSYVLVHDNLDSELVYLQVLKISGNLLGVDGSPLVYNIFNGINRGSFHSEFSIIRILFY